MITDKYLKSITDMDFEAQEIIFQHLKEILNPVTPQHFAKLKEYKSFKAIYNGLQKGRMKGIIIDNHYFAYLNGNKSKNK